MSNSQFRTSMQLFFFTFFYVIVSGLLIQCLILPYVFPGLHAGDGLLKGMDTAGFHHEALELLAKMNVNGWSVWSLRPEGMNSPPGMMAALYYLLGPKPYFLLPLNGLFWGVTAVIWYAIFQCIFPKNEKWNLIPVLLMIILPSSFQWTTQFLKDLPGIAGMSLFFYAFIYSMTEKYEDSQIKQLLKILTSLLLGTFLIWIVRPYLLQFVVAASFAVFPVVAMAYFTKKISYKIMGTVSLVILMTLLLNYVGNSVFRVKDHRHDRLNLAVPIAMPAAQINLFNLGVIRLQQIRNGYCNHKGKVGSAIDCDVNMANVMEAIVYLPRALEIALFSPFPNMWFAKATNPGGSQMRLVAGMEMSIAYMIFAFTFMLLISGRVKLTLPMILAMIYLLTPLLIQTYGNPEIGTLYRMRYLFWTGLVGISLNLIIGYFLSRKQEVTYSTMRCTP